MSENDRYDTCDVCGKREGENHDLPGRCKPERARITVREVAALRADQKDWRKGVALIASALGEHNPPDLSCVRIAEKALHMRAELVEAKGHIEAVRDESHSWYQSQQLQVRRAEKAEGERDAMRPVVEAACEVRDLRRSAGMPVTSTDAAVDAYREANDAG